MACLIGALPVAQILRDLQLALARSRQAEDESQKVMERLRTEIDEHKRSEQALSKRGEVHDRRRHCSRDDPGKGCQPECDFCQ